MTLIEPDLAASFLAQYKLLLSEVTGKELISLKDFTHARDKLYEKEINLIYSFDDRYDKLFISAVQNGIYGTFIYGKKYKQGYALKDKNNNWHCVKCLTTPLEELLPDWIVIDTAILEFNGHKICDGLINSRNMFIGENMIHDMKQELKEERKKW